MVTKPVIQSDLEVKNAIPVRNRNLLTESEERTAFSFLIGFRQYLARKINDKSAVWTALELHNLIDTMLKKIKRHKITEIDLAYIYNPPKGDDEVWGVIQEAIERSKIQRYPWFDILGHSLTQEIIKLRNKGKTCNETYLHLLKDVRVQQFIEMNETETLKIMDHLKISVHARYGENNTAERVKEGIL